MFKDSALSSMQTRQHIEKLIRVSQMYYDEGLNQSQIAGEVGYSRSSVSRMLTEARETGIVQITIGHPLQRLQSLEENLRDKYGLKTVRVAYSYDDSIASTLVPQCAAQLLVENLKPDSLIVTSTGTPMAATIRALPPLDYPRAHVTQMLGSLSSANSLTDSPEICRMMAERLGCAYSLLPAPLIMGSAEVAQAVRSEKLIAMTLALGNRADIAIVGVGAIRQGHSGRIFHSFEDAAVARELQEKGVVGHICGHHIDMHGNHVRTSLCERTISIDFERFRDIPLVIGVAWETWRARALHACLVGGLMSALATNQGMAELLLDMD
ncbi:MAG: sugar-binding domain-containing protein [Bifidobacterium adolescentis]|uniref:sugar-binding transcriptional regulator n=1 Tax=Bifidobacterium adolescentis TaxID=1680 RepID=UPI00189CE7B3|nr:sugar-binding domain-containing protein [Bifidobacterium adolescentis]MDB1525220.1 sugar-binding domain-containing protein [Bifidobacterium adolescentis]MDB1526933.1 sugar-binding domain-containing protein [Bifidobacterium adolescentis]MDB1533774.1 sugar-binding domain-containing protein [Bifidobacterium adolescentis]MDB1542536.1 sugar-binding domain-containing protein [Bifidobacterium adolescentis]